MVAYTQLSAPIDITPVDDGIFQDIDVSAYVTNASGVLVRIARSGIIANKLAAIRKKGSTDDLFQGTPNGSHAFVAIGIDADNIFQVKLEDTSSLWEVDLIGYFNADDFVFFDNAKSVTPTTNVWTDFDLSSHTGSDTAIAAVCFAFSASSTGGREVGYRAKGSTDDRHAGYAVEQISGSPIIGVDGSEVFQVFRNNNFVGDIYCVGYAKSGVTMNTNAVDASLGTTGAWADLSLEANAGMFVEIVNTTTPDESWGLRPDGAADFDFYNVMGWQAAWSVVGAVSGVVEGKIESTNIDFYITGTIDEDVVGTSASLLLMQQSFRQ